MFFLYILHDDMRVYCSSSAFYMQTSGPQIHLSSLHVTMPYLHGESTEGLESQGRQVQAMKMLGFKA